VRRLRTRCERDRGTATLFVVGVAVAFLVFTGLVVDGGLALASRRDAANVAEEAARAGVQTIDEEELRDDGAITLAANASGVALAKIPGSIGNATVTSRSAVCAGTQCTVTITIRRSTTLLQLAGIGSTSATVTGRARIARGVDQEEG
jgi:Flp pilus assembly protein TadG